MLLNCTEVQDQEMSDSMLNQNRQHEFQIMGLCNIYECMFQIPNKKAVQIHKYFKLFNILATPEWLMEQKILVHQISPEDKNVNCPMK